FSSYMLLLPRESTLFPYTTLFRSYQRAVQAGASHALVTGMYFVLGLFSITVFNICTNLQPRWEAAVAVAWFAALTLLWLLLRNRSEEHTSELQSRENLVCRLLLEK